MLKTFIFIAILSCAIADTLYWAGDFETCNLSQWEDVLEAEPGRIQAYSASSEPSWPHPRQGKCAARFVCNNNDFRDPNVRAQLDGPVLFAEGDERWIGWSTYFPTDFPAIPDWFMFAEFYGAPFDGSPCLGFDVNSKGQLAWGRDASHGYDQPWTTPLKKGVWHDFVIHVLFSQSNTVGYTELWFDGVQQKFVNGQTRMYGSTMMQGQTQLFPIANNYREVDSIQGNVTVFHDAMKVGSSYAIVAPGNTTSTSTSGPSTTSSSSSSTTGPSNGYLGCYKDQGPNHDITGGKDTFFAGNMTVEYCRSSCAERNNTYAGLEQWNQCYCGNSYGKYGKDDESNCNAKCQGDTSEICGGPSDLSVYTAKRSSLSSEHVQKHGGGKGHIAWN